MNYKEYRKRLLAADKLLRQKTTSRRKFESIRKLIKGINPTIDGHLAKISKTLKKLDKIKKHKVIDLTLEHLPEKTKEQKKRKKLLFLLIRNWKKLGREVKKLEKEIQQQQNNQTPTADKITGMGRVAALAKGPLGAVTIAATIIAVGIVTLKSKSVKVVIKNQGCQTIQPRVSLPISIPGLKLPDQPIPDGGKAMAELPPLSFTVDGSSDKAISLSAYGMNFNFQLQGTGNDVTFNGQSLLGKRTQIRLGSAPQHEIILRCTSALPGSRKVF